MKQQLIELNKLGLEPMTQYEMENIDGGKFLDWVVRVGCAIAIVAGVAGSAGIALIGIAIAGTGMAFALDI